MRAAGPAMPLARRVASACHLSLLGRSAPEASRLLDPSASRPTASFMVQVFPRSAHTAVFNTTQFVLQLSSLSLEPELVDHSVEAGVFDLELSRHGSRLGSRSGSRTTSRQPSLHGGQQSASLWRPEQLEGLALSQAAVPSFLTRKVLDWSWPQGLAETQLLQDVVQLKPLSRGQDGFEVVLLAEGLTERGWKVQLCCQGSSCKDCKLNRSTAAGLDNLHHQYIHCSRSPENEAMDTIIEPRFRELFQIGPATPLYTGLMVSVPQQFVGRPAKLALLAELLSAESVAAFQENGWTLPPWRKVSSMLAKWGLQLPSSDLKDQSIRGAGSPMAAQCLFPPLRFEPMWPLQLPQPQSPAHQSTAPLGGLHKPPMGLFNSRDACEGGAEDRPTPGNAACLEGGPNIAASTRHITQQPQQPRSGSGSFTRMLLSGGLWGVKPEAGRGNPPGPTGTQQDVTRRGPLPKRATGILAQPEAGQPSASIHVDILDHSKQAAVPAAEEPGASRPRRSHQTLSARPTLPSDKLPSAAGGSEAPVLGPGSSTSEPPQQPVVGVARVAVSQLAKDLAKAPSQQQQEQATVHNPFQSWSHLLQPVTTVKLAGRQPRQQPPKGKPAGKK